MMTQNKMNTQVPTQVDARRQQIEAAAKHEDSDGYFGFISGAEWADANPNCVVSPKKFVEIMDSLNGCMVFIDGVKQVTLPESEINKLFIEHDKLQARCADYEKALELIQLQIYVSDCANTAAKVLEKWRNKK